MTSSWDAGVGGWLMHRYVRHTSGLLVLMGRPIDGKKGVYEKCRADMIGGGSGRRSRKGAESLPLRTRHGQVEVRSRGGMASGKSGNDAGLVTALGSGRCACAVVHLAATWRYIDEVIISSPYARARIRVARVRARCITLQRTYLSSCTCGLACSRVLMTRARPLSSMRRRSRTRPRAHP